MILGVGVDIVEVPRFDRARPALLERLFTPRERRYSLGRPRAALHLAGRFASKEAFLKALGTGYAGDIGWKDLEVVNRENGSPKLETRGRAMRLCRKLGVRRVHLSISHTQAHAVALVVIER